MQANSGGSGSQPPGHHGPTGPLSPYSSGAMPLNSAAPSSQEEERDIEERLADFQRYVNEQIARVLRGLTSIHPLRWDIDALLRAKLYSDVLDRYYALLDSYWQCIKVQNQPMQHKQGSSAPNRTPKQPMQHKQGSLAPNCTPNQPMQHKQGSSAPPKRLPLAVDNEFIREMSLLMDRGHSDEDTPPFAFPAREQNPRQRSGPCGRSDEEVAILSSRGLCFRCGIKGHRATDKDAPCKGHPVTATAAIRALSHANSTQSSAARTNPDSASTARMSAASGDAIAATASAYLFGATHGRLAASRTIAPVGRIVGILPTTAAGWTRWESYVGSNVRQCRLDENGNPWMKGDKILSAEKLDPIEYGGTRNDRDLGLCKTWFLLGRCDFDWFWCPFRHWKPEGCERSWMSNDWWQKHMEKFTSPLLAPDHPNAKYAGAPRTYFNGTQFIP